MTMPHYRLTIVNEETLNKSAEMKFTRPSGLAIAATILLLLFAIAALCVAYTPLRSLLPGFVNNNVQNQIVTNALRADSLEEVLKQHDAYITTLKAIFSGEVKVDTLHTIDSLNVIRADQLLERSELEDEFIAQYEEREMYNLTNVRQRSDTDGLIFHRPARGLLTAPYDPEASHSGVDITANPRESILSILDGTVLLSAYTAEAGYLLVIQHSRDFISVYKHCGTLLRQVGDRVAAGEVVATIASASSERDDAPHLHFELWRRGETINPEKYILF